MIDLADWPTLPVATEVMLDDLNVLSEAFQEGALIISPDIPEQGSNELRCALTRLIDQSKKGTACSARASYEHAVDWREGMDALRTAKQRARALVRAGQDQVSELSFWLTICRSRLRAMPLVRKRRVEPGELGVLLRACEEALEVVLIDLTTLRKEDYDEAVADLMAEDCEELSRRAQAVAYHIKHVGLY